MTTFSKNRCTISDKWKYNGMQVVWLEPSIPDYRRFKPGIETSWPDAVTIDGEVDDASTIPRVGDDPYAELVYLSGFGDTGYCKIMNTENGVGFGLEWDASQFEYVWFWQERYATQDTLWLGNTYATALEPWTSKWTDDPEAVIKKGDGLTLDPKSTISTTIKAYSIDQ